MSQIAPRKFYDDVDNQYEIKRVLRRDRYKRSFNFLYAFFFNEHQPWVTSAILQEALCIADHSYSYQILSSFTTLNLLSKEQPSYKRYIIFHPKNESWWDKFNKEMKKKEGGKESK